jgi:dipeptidyl aminopeptidase/acylaminoacyl peptidase
MMGAGICNWLSFTGSTDIPEENAYVHWALPMNANMDAYWQGSPLSQITNAQTPTLILHGGNDARVPVGQAHEMHRALKEQGVDTQLVIYPRAGHGIRERAHRIDVITRMLDWFDRYVKGETD